MDQDQFRCPIYLEISCLRSKHLTGIGRYAYELTHRLAGEADIGQVQGIVPLKYWVKNRAKLEEAGIPCKPYFLGSSAFLKGIVHGLDFKLPPAPQAGRVVTVHDMACFEEGVLEHRFAVAGRRKFLLMLSTARPHALIAVSDFVAERIKVFLPEWANRTFIVKHGADHIKTIDLPNQQTSRAIILALGTLEKRKNQITLIKAFNLLADGNKELELVLIGLDGFGAEFVHQAVSKSQFRERIKIHGYLPQAELNTIMNQAAVMVYPSVYEGFGIPILEGMAAGKALITSNFGAMAEVAGEGAMLCNTRSAEALADAIKRLIESDHLRDQFVAKGKERLTHFSWDLASEQTLEVYRNVMKGLK